MIYLEIRRKGEPSLVPLVERWVDYEDDGKNLLAHMDDHTLYSNDPKNEKTHKKVNGVDYHYTFSASIPVRMRDSNDRKNKKGDLLVNTSDIAVYVARAEELADDKASSLAGSFISTKNGYFVKYKVLISSPPSYEVVVYERDENTSEPIIHSYWWTDRDGLQSGPLKWQGFPLPKSEVSARENSLKIKDSGKVYYKEYEVCEPEESKDRKIEEKTKEFDYWSKARKFYLENKWVYKAERLHYGDVEETLERGVEATIKDPMDDAEYWVDLITQKSNALLSSGDLAGLKVDELKSIYETYKALMSIAKRELKDSDIWELMKNNRARKLLVGMSDDGRKGFLEEYIGFLQDIKDKNATIDDVVDLIEDDIRTRRLPESLDLLEAGYDGYSMSNNARAAYANDEKPLSKWSKEDILYCASRINKYKAMLLKKVSLDDLRSHLLTRTSWHHTSSYYNQTDFYSFDEEAYENVHESDINRWVEVHKQDVADKKKETPRVRKGRIDYLVWSGSRAHPRASEEHLDNVNIEERGSFYVITDDSGKEILRKKIGSNGTHVKFYESIDRIDDDLGILAFDNAKEAAYYTRKNASKYLRVSAFEGSAIGGGNVYLVGNMMDVNHGEMVRAAVANGYISKDCSDRGYYDCYAFPSKELDDNYNLYLLLGDFSTYVQFVYDGFLLYCVDDYGEGESFKGTELVKALGPAKSIEKVGLDDECDAVLPYDQIEHDDLDESMNLSGEFLKLATPYMLRNDGALFDCSPMHPYIMRKHEKPKIVGMLKRKDQTKIDALNWFHDNTNNPELRKTIDIVLNYFGIKESGVYKPSEEEILDFIEQANNMGNQEFLRLRTSSMLYGGTDNSLFARISSIDFNWYPLLFSLLTSHKNIGAITICKDSNTFGGRFDAYSINGVECNSLPVDEFLCIKGSPIVESMKSEHDVINKAIGFLKEGKPLNEAYDHMHPRYLNGWYGTEVEEMLDDNLKHSQHPIETKLGESLDFVEAKREVPKTDEFDYPIYQDFLYLVHGRKYKAIPSDKIGKIDNLMDGFLKARDEQIALSRQLDKYNLDPNKSRLFFYDHEDALSPDALKLYHDEYNAYIKELNILQELSDLVDSTYESLNFTSIDSCNAIEVFSKCIRGKSDDEILKMANISAKHDAAADYGAMFCFPNGAVISTKKTHNDLMMSLLKGVLRHSYGDALDIDVSTSVVANLVNYMLDERGWARFNSGTRHETRRYCVLPDSMTSEQYQRLHEFLVFGESSSAEAIQVFVGRDEAYHSFDLRYSNADEILRSIKMFYSRGWFSESFSNTKRNLEDNIMNSQNQIEEGCNMSKRRVREDWSYIPLDVMDMKRHGVFDSFVDLFMHDGEKSWQIRIKKAFENAGLKVSLQGEGNNGEVWYVYDGGIILSEFRCQGNYLTATTNMKHNQNSVWKYIAGINGRFSRDGLKSNINLESSNWECFAKDLGNYIYRYNQHLQREVDFRKEYVGKTLVAQKSRDDSTPIDVVIEDSMIGFDYGSGDYNRPCFYISTHSLSTSPYFVVKLKRTKETALTCSIRKEEDTSKWVYQPNYKNVEIENPFDQAFIGLKYEEPKPKGHREFTLDSLLTGMKKRGIIDKNTPSSGPVYIPEENIDDFKKAYEERFECARGIPLNVFTELSRILHPETWKLFCRKGLWPRYFKHHTSIDIYVPNGVDSIPPYGFEPSFSTYDDVRSGRYSLTLNIKNIPSSVTSIGDFAFMDNRMAEFPEIPSSVTSIGRGAFKRCHNMKSLTIPDSVTSIGEDAFKECGVNTKGGLIIKTKSERVAKLCREAGCNNVEIVESLRESLSLLNETPEKHDTLNPKIWDIESNTLKPEVKEKIMEIVDDFCKGLEDDEIKFNLKDVRLVGSNCSYNYNDKSDLDIHLIMDTKSLKCPDNLYPLLYSSYRSLWNKGHDIDFYGIPVEIFVETDDTLDMNESLRRSVSDDDVRWLRNWMDLDREPYLKSFDEVNCKAHYAFNGTSKMSLEDFLKYGEYDKFIENLEAKGFHIDVYKADYSYKTVGTYTVAHGRRGANRDRTLNGLIQFDITW